MEDKYIYTQGKRLRCGFTTGTCAQAAARAAAIGFFTGEIPAFSEVTTPDGTKLKLLVEEPACGTEKKNGLPFAACAVRKDAGDDIDVTDGMLVFAKVSVRGKSPATSCPESAGVREVMSTEPRTGDAGVRGISSAAPDPELIRVLGGVGVGRVTKPGLDQPVGEAAINSTPRRLIREEVEAVMEEMGEEVPLDVEIFLPDGAERAKKTMNERLGILGGLSILGTTGIVEPQSHRALIETIRAELSVHHASGERELLITPGNYGTKFIETHEELFRREEMRLGKMLQKEMWLAEMHPEEMLPEETLPAKVHPAEIHPADMAVKCSNFIGDTLDAAMEFGFAHVTLVGHIGKLVKLAGGMMNTHSMYGDCRMELLAACGLQAGVPRKQLLQILECVTCDEALRILSEENYLEPVMKLLGDRIFAHLNYHCKGKITLRVVMFSNIYGVLADICEIEK